MGRAFDRGGHIVGVVALRRHDIYRDLRPRCFRRQAAGQPVERVVLRPRKDIVQRFQLVDGRQYAGQRQHLFVDTESPQVGIGNPVEQARRSCGRLWFA